MKGICITDVHLQNSKPKSRLDEDYLANQLEELRYVFVKAEELGVTNVVCSGDLGHTYHWEPRTINLLHNLCSEYGITIITTLGQHDVLRHNLQGYKVESSLNILEKSGIVKVLIGGNYIELSDQIVYGFGWNEPETEQLLAGDFQLKTINNEKRTVAIIHASIGGIGSVGAKDLINNQNIRGFDYAFFGDIHEGFLPYVFESGTIAASAGALARRNINDANRPPRYIEYTLEGKRELAYRTIPHPPKEILFDLQSKRYEKVAAKTWKTYAENAAKITQKNPVELVKEVAQINKIPDAVTNLVLENMVCQ